MRIAALLACLLIWITPFQGHAGPEQPQASAGGVIGVGEAQLTPAYWVRRLWHPDRVLLAPAQIAAQNARLLREDRSMHDLRALPATLGREQVLAWIDGVSQRPTSPRYDVHGEQVSAAVLDWLAGLVDREGVPASQPVRFGLVVHRAALRSFPTDLEVFSRRNDTDIDRFQESALFPGTPVVIVHRTRDGQWSFVVSPNYAAWMRTEYLAEGRAEQVFGYVDAAPYRVITGATVSTVYTREEPRVSRLQLDMGVRVPLWTDWPVDTPVNGEGPYGTWVVRLPVREADGSLAFSPALIPKNADIAPDYLPLTRGNLVRQAFKFLGERYGWGHAYDTRDCSGFASEVYRSFGVQLPRNTSDLGASPSLERTPFDGKTPSAVRQSAAAKLVTGDLIFIPGHVMLMLGRIGGHPYVIHDTTGMRYRTADGLLHHLTLNAVSVTPLQPLLFNENQTYIDRMTSIVHPYRRHPGRDASGLFPVREQAPQ